MMESSIIFFFLIFLAAVLYSSVGHGGASGYLAVMAIFTIAPDLMRATALSMNLFVSGISFFTYAAHKHFKFKLLWPFIITSIPFSYLGARMPVNVSLYKFILAFFLIIAVARMVFIIHKSPKTRNINIPLAIAIGAVLGFCSGMIGIGGGIILSPILLLLGWANMKQIAATSAIFIFLNSGSGILGVISAGAGFHSDIWWLIAIGTIGSIIGSQFGVKLNVQFLSYVLIAVLSIAIIKLLFF